MNHQTASTSREAYRKLDAAGLYGLILGCMADGREWCIADLSAELKLQKSTLSPRLGELLKMRKIVYTTQKSSRSTHITAKHYRIRPPEAQPSLFGELPGVPVMRRELFDYEKGV